MIRATSIIVLVFCIGCNDRVHDQASNSAGAVDSRRDPETGEVFHALDRSVPDQRSVKFQPDKPFRLAFGRGSGLRGLETIEIDESLNAELFRQTPKGWETCVIKLTLDEWAVVADSIGNNNLYALKRAYHADVADGSQWIFWVTQDGISKSVYCNNFFPDSLRLFARDVDAVFDIDDDLLEWTAVPANLELRHDDRIWNAIKDQ